MKLKDVLARETFVKDLQPGQILKDLEAEKHTDDIVMILSVERQGSLMTSIVPD